jgi:hypothetical protein
MALSRDACPAYARWANPTRERHQDPCLRRRMGNRLRRRASDARMAIAFPSAPPLRARLREPYAWGRICGRVTRSPGKALHRRRLIDILIREGEGTQKMKHAEMSQRYVTYLSRPSTCSAVLEYDSRLVSWTGQRQPLSDSRRETGSAICYGRANR